MQESTTGAHGVAKGDYGFMRGEQLRVAVAEKVVGWAWQPMPEKAKEEVMNPFLVGPKFCPPGYPWALDYEVPRYESDIAAAFEVVQHMAEQGWVVEIQVHTAGNGVEVRRLNEDG
ncbi:MAG TPA: hypothetical protein VFK80_04740, partial [Limnochordia bacterium]|nr:hypothetical protein [Limnochordia bacterium]